MLIVILKSIWFDLNPISAMDYLSKRSKGWSENKGWPSVWRQGRWPPSLFRGCWTRRGPEDTVFGFYFFLKVTRERCDCLPREAVHFSLWRVSSWLSQKLTYKSAIAVPPLALWEYDSLFKDPKVHLFGYISKTLKFCDRHRRKNIIVLWQLVENRIQSLCQVHLFLR